MTNPKQGPIPSDAELAILRVLWATNRATAREIHDTLNAGREEQRVVTTTAKLLQIMLEKGLVERDDSTWPHTYKARVARRAVQRGVVGRTVAQLFEKSASQFILAALETGKPDAEELDEIKAMLAEYEERQKKK